MNTRITRNSMNVRRYVTAGVVAAALALASLGATAVSANPVADDAAGSIYPPNGGYVTVTPQLPLPAPYVTSNPVNVLPAPFIGGLQTDTNADRN